MTVTEAGAETPNLTGVQAGGEGDKGTGLTAETVNPRASPAERTTREHRIPEALENANTTLESFGVTNLKFSYDRKRGQVMIQVLKMPDKPGEKEQVIQEIPPGWVLKLAETLLELRGMLFDQQV
ncbi:MAG: flagellar protein FlaG [Nitrospinae bacterium]|nr:flagellar protein FlaG [Nitrospinota bacterium]